MLKDQVFFTLKIIRVSQGKLMNFLERKVSIKQSYKSH
jgi:hypothetical protein